MTSYELTEVAEEDLIDLRLRIIDTNGPRVAKKIIGELDETLTHLSDFPGLGRSRPDLTDEPVSFFPFYSWLIIYEPKSAPLQIIRIVSAYRDSKTSSSSSSLRSPSRDLAAGFPPSFLPAKPAHSSPYSEYHDAPATPGSRECQLRSAEDGSLRIFLRPDGSLHFTDAEGSSVAEQADLELGQWLDFNIGWDGEEDDSFTMRLLPLSKAKRYQTILGAERSSLCSGRFFESRWSARLGKSLWLKRVGPIRGRSGPRTQGHDQIRI